MKRHRRLSTSVSLIALSAACITAGQAHAQATDDTTVQEVVVTGIRGSLQKSLNIKRENVGVVDAISAEDIGKFPDSSIGAAIQRIPGISISRGVSSMSASVPTSTGDASGVTVRGFGPSFNETLFDGRQVSSGTGNRGFDFSAVGADFVSQVDVMKTPDASLSSGAIGATINIKYPKPLDHTGLRLAGSLSGSYSPEEKKATPNGGILFSNTFANDTFGVLAVVNYSDKKTLGNHVNNQGWVGTTFTPAQLATPGATGNTTGWFTQDYGVYQEHTQDKRIDGRVAVQWRPTENLLLTLNDNYSKDKLTQDQYGYSIWFNGGNLTNVTLNSNGTATNFIQPGTPTDFQAQFNGQVLENNEVGFNAKWDVSEKLKVEFDADSAVSRLNPDGQLSSIDVDVGYGSCRTVCTNNNNVGVTGFGDNSLPHSTAFGPNGDASRFLDPSLMGSHVVPITSNQNKDTVTQFKLMGTWTEENIKISAGAHYLEDKQQLRSYSDFQNNQWQAYAGYGPASGSDLGVALPANLFGKSFSTSNFISGWDGNGGLPARILQFDPYAVLNYLQGLGNPQTKTIPGFNTGCCNPNYDGTYKTIEVPGSHQNISEKTFAAFLNVNFDTEVADRPLKINVGVREEETRTTSEGIGQQPVNLAQQAGDVTALIATFGPSSTVTAKNKYRYLLPNLDLNYSITDKLKLRFDASRTLTRPPLNFLTPVTNVASAQRVGALVATGGNPDLLPFLSDNLDLGLEWYYSPNSYISIDGFTKEVSNFIVSGTTRQTINNVIDPTTGQPGQFSVTTNVNGPSAQVRGLEAAIQHVFGETGFGFQANATVVDTNKPYNPKDLSVGGFAVTGLANSANLVAFYDKHGFQARIAVNWRDEYLDHFGQHQNTSAFGSEPTFVDSNTQVDFSTSYDVNPNISVYFEALNLNNSTYSTHGRFSEQLLDVIDFGRRLTFGVHVKM
ncbi:TonB-dependent receptor [Caulobacter soli]|uniref:TonB-dependent receptor n=1 Tax=Caulobacter soli TaxID=2708539 RepID=UPI0013EC85A3|nr:TonB-dependent receptor [Caulobacter soli]